MTRLMCCALALSIALLPVSWSGAVPAVIRGAINVEDMIETPDGRWVIGSSMALAGEHPGGLYAVRTSDKSVHPVYPLPGGARPATGTECQEISPTLFAPHGLALHRAADDKWNLYVVNHGMRESIETFALTLSGNDAPPQLTWSGCIVLPANTEGNSVAVARDGTLYLTVTGDLEQSGRRPAAAPSPSALPPSGVMAWHSKTGWRLMATGPLAMSNGTVLSADGRFLYVVEWLGKTVLEFDLTEQKVHRRVQVSFMPDNVRRAPNGALWVAGQNTDIKTVMGCYLGKRTECSIESAVARIDTRTLSVDCSRVIPASPEFSSATVALEVGDELWLGSFRGSSIANVKLSDCR